MVELKLAVLILHIIYQRIIVTPLFEGFEDVDAKIAYDKAVEEYNAKIDTGEIKGKKIVDEYSSTDGFITFSK